MADAERLIHLQRIRLAGLAVTSVESAAVLAEKVTGFDSLPDAVDIALSVGALIAWLVLGVVEVRERSLAAKLAADVADLEKRRGRERESADRRQHRRDRVENLIEGHEYPVIEYRTVFELASQRVMGTQAMTHYGPGSSEPWLAQAETFGLRSKLELKALVRAVRVLAEQPDLPFVLVPCTLSTLVDGALVAAVEKTDPARVILELTGDELITDYSPHLTAVENLRRRGVRLAVGNFTGGHAALRHIVELRPQFIRLDYVPRTGGDSVIPTLISLAALVGATVIADGVDHDNARRQVAELGAVFGIGRLVSGAPETNTAVRP